MDATVEIPLWLVLILLLGSCYAILISVLLPSVRWIIRRRVNQTIEKLNSQLRIKIRPFQRTKRQILIDRLIYDAKVIEEIESLASSSDMSREQIQSRVYNYAREIVPAFNALVYFRLGYWLAKKVSRFVYRVKVGAADTDKLAEIDPQATVVFVMNHRSNMDYLLVTYLAADQVSLSYAVGEWARVFPLQSLIKALGGFFVRRNSKDSLYRKVLERYVHMSTYEGVCQAVYLEGRLTRDGNIGDPKLGFLDYMLRDWDIDNDRDIVFVPIGINYDHVLEDENMIATLSDKKNRKGSLQYLKDVLSFLKLNFRASAEEKLLRYGYASVNFGIPLSAKEFSKVNDIDFRGLDKVDRFAYVEKLSTKLLMAIKHVVPILPVPLVATVFEENPKSKLHAMDVVEKVNQLITQLMSEGSAMQNNEKPKQQTISQSLSLLVSRHILIRDKHYFWLNTESTALVQYYSNSIRHFHDESAKT
ncbi:MAG: 1-acyl-sn-glycerol-3-phosphate acyltransferase [Pseudomonadales bacterium]|nr:1-acyl-sn-glycerol-3-phosphate acyltransferase [Pseudomonadales bacterium]